MHALNLGLFCSQHEGMSIEHNHAQEWQNKPSFREVLAAVYGHPVSDQEAADALFTLTEFFKLLDVMDREQNSLKQEADHV